MTPYMAKKLASEADCELWYDNLTRLWVLQPHDWVDTGQECDYIAPAVIREMSVADYKRAYLPDPAPTIADELVSLIVLDQIKERL